MFRRFCLDEYTYKGDNLWEENEYMNPNIKDMRLRNEENVSGIEEILNTSRNIEWRIIENKRVWIKKCPTCNVEQFYSRKGSCNNAILKSSKCKKCSMTGRKITWVDKVSSALKGRGVPPEQEIKRLESRLKMSYTEYLLRRPKFFTYKSNVMSITRRQNLRLLDHYDKPRTLAGESGGYQLDHIITIKDGFSNNINPHIIGNIRNLRFITWEENLKKNRYSDVKIDIKYKNTVLNEVELELLKEYSKFDGRLYKIMNNLTELWYENPSLSKEDAMAMAREINKSNVG